MLPSDITFDRKISLVKRVVPLRDSSVVNFIFASESRGVREGGYERSPRLTTRLQVPVIG